MAEANLGLVVVANLVGVVAILEPAVELAEVAVANFVAGVGSSLVAGEWDSVTVVGSVLP